METLKKLLIYLSNIRYSLFFFLLILPFQISKGCGPYHLTFEGYTFLNPNIVDNNATFAPYFLKFNDLYKSPDSLEYIQQDENKDNEPQDKVKSSSRRDKQKESYGNADRNHNKSDFKDKRNTKKVKLKSKVMRSFICLCFRLIL